MKDTGKRRKLWEPEGEEVQWRVHPSIHSPTTHLHSLERDSDGSQPFISYGEGKGVNETIKAIKTKIGKIKKEMEREKKGDRMKSIRKKKR